MFEAGRGAWETSGGAVDRWEAGVGEEEAEWRLQQERLGSLHRDLTVEKESRADSRAQCLNTPLETQG